MSEAISTSTVRTIMKRSTRHSSGDPFAGRIAVLTAIFATIGALASSR